MRRYVQATAHRLEDELGPEQAMFIDGWPTIAGSPAAVAHGAGFSVQTPTPATIAEVVLMSPGAVTHGFNQNQRYDTRL